MNKQKKKNSPHFSGPEFVDEYIKKGFTEQQQSKQQLFELNRLIFEFKQLYDYISFVFHNKTNSV